MVALCWKIQDAQMLAMNSADELLADPFESL